MTIIQLKYFQTVYKYNGISKAAEALNISQPSVSNAIRELEDEFNVLLFTRYKKRLKPTKEGTRFFELSKEILEKVEKTKNIMQNIANIEEIKLGVPPMLCSVIIPVLYAKQHMHNINIIESDKSGLVKMLNAEDIDIAFLPHCENIDKEFESVIYAKYQNVCCVNKNHMLSNKKSINFNDICNQKLVLFKNSFFQTERILNWFTQNDFEPDVFLNAAQVSTVMNVIKNNLAVGFVFDFLIDSFSEVVGIPLEPPMYTNVSLVWKKDKHLNANILKFIEYVLDISKMMDEMATS